MDPYKGFVWLEGVAESLYNHAVVINGQSCLRAASPTHLVMTAGSLHPGGRTWVLWMVMFDS